MSGLTDEQRAEIERQVKAATEALDAKYAAKAGAFRAWINAHPLTAARVIGSACLLAGFAIGAKFGAAILRAFA